MRKSLVVILMLLLAVCGYVKSNGNVLISKFNIKQSGHNFYINGLGMAGPVLSVDDSFNFIGDLTENNINYYRYNYGTGTLDIFDIFIIRSEKYDNGEEGYVKTYNGYTAITLLKAHMSQMENIMLTS